MKNTNQPPDPPPATTSRAWAWTLRHRSAMAANALRGACYSTGAGLVGLIFWWFQHRL
ncbi:hypothetical protein [Streptomyces jumonjinensis]|uniref:hypothetical protein n=1 Tax=Streptomyces jumonjinensis TaxID=1945 RepID=UPI0037B13B43